jgi:hypothetical protein
MKKILLVLILIVVFSGVAFAHHPNDQMGIGVMFRWDTITWGNDYGNTLGVALSLKAPGVPIFWGVNFGFRENYFGLGVTGDKYFMEGALVPAINLHMFVGLGFYGSLFRVGDAFSFQVGARLPIGLSWHVIEMLEVFVDVAPSFGIRIASKSEKKIKFPAGSLPLEVGFRLWLN